MSADYEALRVQLRTKLATATGYPGHSKVQWENVPFEPPDPDGTEGMWLREHLVPGSERLTSTRFQECLGLYYLYVNAAVGHATKPAHDLAKAILDVFPPTLQFTGIGASVYRSERLPPRLEGIGPSGQLQSTWYSVPVVVYWRTFAAIPA